MNFKRLYRMKNIKSKYTKDGIMRRNKLLLEHILVRLIFQLTFSFSMRDYKNPFLQSIITIDFQVRIWNKIVTYNHK